MKQTPRIERRNKYILCSGLEWNSGFEAKNNVSIQWTVGQLNSCTFLEVTLLVFSRTVLRQSTSPFNKPLASLIAKYTKLFIFLCGLIALFGVFPGATNKNTCCVGSCLSKPSVHMNARGDHLYQPTFHDPNTCIASCSITGNARCI